MGSVLGLIGAVCIGIGGCLLWFSALYDGPHTGSSYVVGLLLMAGGCVVMLVADHQAPDEYKEMCINGTAYYYYNNALAPAYINDKLVKCR